MKTKMILPRFSQWHSCEILSICMTEMDTSSLPKETILKMPKSLLILGKLKLSSDHCPP